MKSDVKPRSVFKNPHENPQKEANFWGTTQQAIDCTATVISKAAEATKITGKEFSKQILNFVYYLNLTVLIGCVSAFLGICAYGVCHSGVRAYLCAVLCATLLTIAGKCIYRLLKVGCAPYLVLIDESEKVLRQFRGFWR